MNYQFVGFSTWYTAKFDIHNPETQELLAAKGKIVNSHMLFLCFGFDALKKGY